MIKAQTGRHGFPSRCRAMVITALRSVVVPMLLVLSILSPAMAQSGGLALSPTRVVLEGKDRTAELVLLNRGKEETTYRISVVEMRMDEEGVMTMLKPDENGEIEREEGELFSESLLRYSPRQVTLAPGQVQRIRIMVRKPSDLPEGEYRSHLLFHAVPKVEERKKLDTDTDRLNVQITVVTGVTIPAIVRHGQLESHVSVSDIALERPALDLPPTHVTFQLDRTGNASVYGDIVVNYYAPNSETAEPVARARGLAVYTPNLLRRVRLPLELPESLKDLQGGRIEVVYREHKEDEQSAPREVLARAEQSLQ